MPDYLHGVLVLAASVEFSTASNYLLCGDDDTCPIAYLVVVPNHTKHAALMCALS